VQVNKSAVPDPSTDYLPNALFTMGKAEEAFCTTKKLWHWSFRNAN